METKKPQSVSSIFNKYLYNFDYKKTCCSTIDLEFKKLD